jgi:uncharacterized protein (TIGR03435 family)
VAIGGNSAKAAPAGFSVTVGSAASTSAVALAASVAQALFWAKLKTAAVPAIAALVLGAGTVAVAHIWPNPDAWRTDPLDVRSLDSPPPQVRILPTKFPDLGETKLSSNAGVDSRYVGIDVKLPTILQEVYRLSPVRMILPEGLSEGGYDYIANLAKDSQTAFRAAILKEFGLTARLEVREMDVLLLQRKVGARQPVPAALGAGTISSFNFLRYKGKSVPISAFARFLEDRIKVPVIDETGLNGGYDLNFEWPYEWPTSQRTLENTNGPLGEQVGLQLVPAKRPIEVLVIERASGRANP